MSEILRPSYPTKMITQAYKDGKNKWRIRIRDQREKLTDQAKEIFLEEYAKHARLGDAAALVGVTPATVRKHVDIDPDFAEAFFEAEELYQSRLIAHQQDLVFNGTTKTQYDRQGAIISEQQMFPIPLVQMELRKHDAGYRDKREVDMKINGGVLVAPSEVTSIEDWESKYSIEGEVVKDVDESPTEELTKSAGESPTEELTKSAGESPTEELG